MRIRLFEYRYIARMYVKVIITASRRYLRKVTSWWKIAWYVHRSFVDACISTHIIVCLIYLTVSQVAMGILMATLIHMGTNRAPAMVQRLRKQIRNRCSPNVSGTRYTYLIACIYRLCVVFPEHRLLWNPRVCVWNPSKCISNLCIFFAILCVVVRAGCACIVSAFLLWVRICSVLLCACVCVSIYMYIHVYECGNICMYTYVHIYIYIYTYKYMCTHIYVCIYIIYDTDVSQHKKCLWL